MVNRIIIFSFFLLLSINVFAGRPSRVKIAFSNLEAYSKKAQKYAYTISSAIDLRLSVDDRFEIVEDEAVTSHLANQNLGYKSQQFDYELLSRFEIKYVVSGSVQVIEGGILVRLRILELQNRRVRYINSEPFSPSQLFASMELVTQDLINELNSRSASLKTKQAAITCFTTNEQSGAKGRALADDLPYSIFYNLPSWYTGIPLERTKGLCNSNPIEDIYESIDADIFLSVRIDQEGPEISLAPQIHISNLNKTIYPIPYKVIAEQSFYGIYDNFSNYVNGILNSIISEGEWNLESFDTENDNKYKDIIGILENRFAQDSLLYDGYNSLILIDQAIKLKPNKAKPYYFKGLLFDKQGDASRAVDSYQKAIQADKKFTEAYLKKGNLYLEFEQYGLALESFKNAKKQSNDQELDYWIGVSYYFQDSLLQAINHLKGINGLPKKKSEIKYYLSDAYYKYGLKSYNNEDYSNAVSSFENALNITDDQSEILDLLINSYNRLGQFQETNRWFEYGLTNQIIDYYYCLDLAQDLRNIKDSNGDFSIGALTSAIEYLKRFVNEVGETDSRPFQLLGSSFLRLNQLDSATNYYKKALDLKPQSLVHILNLSEAAIMSKDFELAENVLNNAINMEFDTGQKRGHELIIHFLIYTSQILSGVPSNAEKAKLMELIDQKEYVYIRWSFETFLRWLDRQGFDANLKKDIRDITIQIDKQKQRK